MDQNNSQNVCKCPHHKVMPVAIILIAVTSLLGTFNVLSLMAVSVIWPILLIIAVAPKLGGCKCCNR